MSALTVKIGKRIINPELLLIDSFIVNIQVVETHPVNISRSQLSFAESYLLPW